MRKTLSVISLIIALPLLLALTKQAVQPQAGQPEWKEFSSKKGGFSVLIPGTPKEELKSEEFPGVGKAEVHLFIVANESGFYLSSYTEIPTLAQVDQEFSKGFGLGFLRTVGEGIAAGAHGKVVKETDISFGDSPGKEILVEVPAGLLTARVYYINRRCYQLLALPAPSSADSGHVKKFLDSFKLIAQ